MKVMRVVAMTLAVTGLGLTLARAQDVWPRTIIVSQGIVVVYQPQVESFEKNRIVGRSAVSITPEGQIEPIFGAAWIEGRVRTDRDSRMVDI